MILSTIACGFSARVAASLIHNMSAKPQAKLAHNKTRFSSDFVLVRKEPQPRSQIMCCFSRPVDRVANTNIFARSSKDGRQFLVYSMTLSAKEDLAMILPIPVPKESKEDAVHFINLEEYPNFFADMLKGFPPPPAARSLGKVNSADAKAALPVVEVGSFEASFVPSVKDFDRLDERFRLPTEVWDKLPMYKDYGFTVFKLKKGAKTIHPMAFEFPRAKPEKLFFPTVHIHDGKVHGTAMFDHLLFCQRSETETDPILRWEESTQPARFFMKVDKSKGLLDPDGHCYKFGIHGRQKNEDMLV
jgi:hypothetical protein